MTSQVLSELAVNITLCWDAVQLSSKVSTLWPNVLPHWQLPKICCHIPGDAILKKCKFSTAP